MSNQITYEESAKIAAALKEALNDSGDFWVQSNERDGLDEERMAVSYQGDNGIWFRLTAEFDIKEKA